MCVPNAFAYLTNSQGLLIVTRAGPSVFLSFFVVAVVLTAGKAGPLDGTAGVLRVQWFPRWSGEEGSSLIFLVECLLNSEIE